ncbi:hypothetical protein [Streptomyces sp. NPDC020917]|uniref:hypothetical protein n=1 Tax=Streptomyces sp. NPDC020917 TaxID=3365102 RepID=UPI00379E7E29
MPQISGEQQFALPSAPPGVRKAGLRPVQRLIAAAAGAVFGYLAASHRIGFVDHRGAFSLFILGFLGALSVSNALLAALARPSGLAVVWAAVGSGRWAGSAVLRGRLVTFRWLPLIPFTGCLAIVDRPTLRRRLWCGTATAVGVQLAAGAALVALGGPDVAALGWGVLVMTALVSFCNPATAGSRAWILLRMPFRPDPLDRLAHEPALVDVARALSAGRVRAARAALDTAANPRSFRHLWATAAVAEAEGRYAEAADRAYALYQGSGLEQDRSTALVIYARALADGAAAGVWTRERMLPAFEAALAVLRATRPALLRFTDLGAIEALLHGDPVKGTRLARNAVATAPDALTRAHALRTLAAALTWTGSAPQAARALTRASRHSPL